MSPTGLDHLHDMVCCRCIYGLCDVFDSMFLLSQAYVTVDGLPLDLLIDGLQSQNRAVCLDSDVLFACDLKCLY